MFPGFIKYAEMDCPVQATNEDGARLAEDLNPRSSEGPEKLVNSGLSVAGGHLNRLR